MTEQTVNAAGDTIDPREPKLPAWARQLLETERRRAHSAEWKWNEYVDEHQHAHSDTWVTTDALDDERVEYPAGTWVTFNLDGVKFTVHVDRSGAAAALVVHKETGTTALAVEPHAANMVHITPGRH